MISRNVYLILSILLLYIFGYMCSVNKSIKSNRSLSNDTKYILKPLIDTFKDEFENIKDKELQVSKLNGLYGSWKLTSKQIDPQKKLDELSEKLKSNIDSIYKALEKAVKNFKMLNTTSLLELKQSMILPNIDIKNDIICESQKSLVNHSSSYILNKVLNNLSHDLRSIKSYLKQVYYLSLSDTPVLDVNSECSITDYPILWKIYMSHISYRTRRVILLIDHGNSIEDNVLALSKMFAKQMISVLNDNDQFTVIAIASKWSSLKVKESCGNQNLPSILFATENNKELSYTFIDNLNTMVETTDHKVGMKIAMKMTRLFYAKDETIMLAYISQGMEFSMSDAMDILMTSDSLSPVIINTCAVSQGTLPTIGDMNMLSDIMKNFFTEKNTDRNKHISRGHLVFINEPYLVGPAVAKFYEVYNNRLQQFGVKISDPLWNSLSKDLFVSFSIGFLLANRIIVVGADMIFTKFFRDIIYYSNSQRNMHLVLTNYDGNVLLHPSIPLEKPEAQIKFTHISKYYSNIRTEMFFEKSKGSYHSSIKEVTYIWKHIKNIYVLCIIVDDARSVPVIPPKSSWLPDLSSSQLISYLLELAGSSTYCNFLGKKINLDNPSLFLSQSCFQYILPKTNESLTLKLLPYLQHESLMLKSEGLQDGIQDELEALLEVAENIRKIHVTSTNSDYIIRRYVATKSGILHIFPGVTIGSSFEPSKRPWFIRAVELQGKLIISPPYLDTGGAGYIITISYATPYIILGIDVTYSYVSKLIFDQSTSCMFNSTCFFVDDRGYLVSHPDLVGSLESDSEPIEQLHMVHKESSVANDFLNHQEIVQKLACNDYTSATIQRYYQLNMSYNDILTSSVRGESCISYSIGPIMNTNLFFGIVKAACPIQRTFCPCSVIDRICLNCEKMERQECECPCECQIYRSSCSNFTSHENYKICDPLLKIHAPDPIFYENDLGGTEQCPYLKCETRSNFLSCLGLIGCQWCEKDSYGFPLEAPFCSYLSTCFNGILGGPNPYNNMSVETIPLFTSIRNTGLILGLIIIFGIVFILIFVCWRSLNTPRNQRMYLSARQEEQLHMSDLNINDDFLEQGNHSDKLLIDEKKGTPLSPYCVTTNYSRPTTAADSDHGYSTMTPHDESEHLSLAPIEIDSLEEDMASDKTTPPSKHRVIVTKIPHKNCIIVPVTVHRHVDAT